MTSVLKVPGQVEYGDFQTPESLAERLTEVICRKKKYRAVIEPTCGVGNILYAAVANLPSLERAIGIEINSEYVARAKAQLGRIPVQIELANFFETDLSSITNTLPQPYIFIGNPPWITSASMGHLNGENLPKKENFSGLSGFDALTGKSNFDISEWILLKILENLSGTENGCAMLVKISVARKIIARSAAKGMAIRNCEIYAIDAKKEFNVSVTACLFYFEGCKIEEAEYGYTAFDDMHSIESIYYAYIDGIFIDDYAAYRRTQKYARVGKGKWRSGIKHDASKVMEIRKLGKQLLRSTGEPLEIEPDLIYPFLKSSDIAKGNTKPRLYTIVTQRSIGESTEKIQANLPKTWAYLTENRIAFDNRRSSIYKGRPPFSIFGIGDYSFAPYKVAISGLYKKLKFTLLEPQDGKCVMVDDTCYFLGFESFDSAYTHITALESSISQDFFMARIKWDDKRPIKKDILDSLDIDLVIDELNREFTR